MPQFGEFEGYQTTSIITGPSHVMLGVRFGRAQSGRIELLKRQAIGECRHGDLDEVRIIEAIEQGVAEANVEYKVGLSVAQAFYIENDSPRYDLFRRCAYLLATRAADSVRTDPA